MTAYAATLGSGATKYEAIQTGVTSADTLVFTIPAAFASARIKASGADVRVRRGAAPATGFYEVVSTGASVPLRRPRDGAWTINVAVPSGTADVSCSVAEGDVGSADNSAAVAADLTAHVAAADPHYNYDLKFNETGVKTADYTAVDHDLVRVDVNTTGSFTVTMPSSPAPTAGRSRVMIASVVTHATRTLTIAGGGANVQKSDDSGFASSTVYDQVTLTTFILTYTSSGWVRTP